MKANEVNNERKKKQKKTLSIAEAMCEWIFFYSDDDDDTIKNFALD